VEAKTVVEISMTEVAADGTASDGPYGESSAYAVQEIPMSRLPKGQTVSVDAPFSAGRTFGSP
jgi:hypothetical protein